MTAKKRRRKRRTQVNRRVAPVLAAMMLIVVVLIGVFISFLIEKYSPSKERMAWTEYYSTQGGDEVSVILNNELTDIKGRMIDGEVYVTTDTVYDYLNPRFYWDQAENLFLYTTPTEVITAAVGSSAYTVGSQSYTESYVPVKVDGDTAYVALAYVQKYTGLQYEVMTDEVNRVNIITEFGTVDTAVAKKDAQVRYRAGIKSPILTDVEKGDVLYVLPEEEDIGDWTKVQTKDGFIGYIRSRSLGEKGQETLTSNYEEPVYTNITKDYTINMAWHQVTNSDANSKVLEMIADTKGLTTISPTWFFLSDNEGNIESLASQSYVNYCHQNGIEVWGLVEDIKYKDSIVDYEILSRTSSRQRLVNNLIAKAIEYDLDGLNIDFEYINSDSSKAFLQFLRELSIRCRQNGIVLSVDNYRPADHNEFYNLEEQGKVVDYVILMGYDEHYAGSEVAGSVASINWVREGIERALEQVPAEKLINAVPFFTRLWEERPLTEEELAELPSTDTSTQVKVSSKAYGMDAIDQVLETNGAEKTWDENAGQYYAEYTADGNTYKVWLEEEDSIALKASLIKEYNLAGISAWKLGFERQNIWDIILRYVN